MTTSRRSFLLGLSSILAAPAIVRASSLMPVKPAAGYFAIEEMPTNHVLWSGAGLEIDFVANIASCPSSGRVLGKAMDALTYSTGSQIAPGRGLLVRDSTAIAL